MPVESFDNDDRLPDESLFIPLPPNERCLAVALDLQHLLGDGQSNAGTGLRTVADPTFIQAVAPESDLGNQPPRVEVTVIGQGFRDIMQVPGEPAIAGISYSYVDAHGWMSGVGHFDFYTNGQGDLQIAHLLRDADTETEPGIYALSHETPLDENAATALANSLAEVQSAVIADKIATAQLGPLYEEANETGARRFHIGDVASLYYGRQLSPRGTEGILDIMRYITGDESITAIHQVPRVEEVCRPYVAAQYGELFKAMEPPDQIDSLEQLADWLTHAANQADGSLVPVGTLPENVHTVIDSATEFEIMLGLDKQAHIVDPKDHD